MKIIILKKNIIFLPSDHPKERVLSFDAACAPRCRLPRHPVICAYDPEVAKKRSMA